MSEEWDKFMLDSYAEWAAARDVIAQAVRDMYPGARGPDPGAFAVAVLARLASHDPPIHAGFLREDEP